ncbi:MAG: hypothetical protein IPP19_08015 [Verrucomicrobia bacterium]|nr:hypothetical protein [Verrucomicrobiota bacterium]
MKTLLLIITALVLFLPSILAENRSERKARIRAESEKPKHVSGGELFTVQQKHDVVYETVLTYLEKQGQTIEAASKETGQITTVISVSGGWKQTGTRYVIVVIKEDGEATSVRAVVKALQVEPWSDPVLEPKASAVLREDLEKTLEPK